MKNRPRRIPWLWLLVVVLLAALLADIFVPVPALASETTKTLRSSALALLASGLFGLLVFVLQSGRSRAERRRDVLRGAYSLLLRAADRVMALDREQQANPKGHHYVGTISSQLSDEYLRHNPFATAEAIGAEIERLYAEADAAIVLEAGPDNPVLDAWQDMMESYYMCDASRRNENDPKVIAEHREELNEMFIALRRVAHVRMRSL
ncbi:MAG: hypothetical protein QOH92_603 [Chloroflexota bacterium]|jgi:hypothetical protein|nr:hypothetical protein [Chloroflexota bacterium]